MANDIQLMPPGGYVAVLPSAARTGTPNTQTIYTTGSGRYAQGLYVVVDMTVFTSTGTLTVLVEGYDPVSLKTWTLLSSTALAAAATTVLRVDPNLTASANLIAKDMVPPVLKFTATHGNGVSLTYSISAMLTG